MAAQDTKANAAALQAAAPMKPKAAPGVLTVRLSMSRRPSTLTMPTSSSMLSDVQTSSSVSACSRTFLRRRVRRKDGHAQGGTCK